MAYTDTLTNSTNLQTGEPVPNGSAFRHGRVYTWDLQLPVETAPPTPIPTEGQLWPRGEKLGS
jgi:hypothetical protein